METSIPALLIAAILMITTVVMARSGYSSVDQMGQSWQVMEQRLEERVRTQLTAVSATVDESYTNVTLQLRNDGQTPVADYARMDVVIQYFSESGTRYARWIPFTTGELQSNTWKVESIENDAFEPGVLNPGEVLEIHIRINPAMGAGTSGWVIVSTENGVTVSAGVTG
jgi:archaellum component FlaF (FlaF/FlaG flagellin family)